MEYARHVEFSINVVTTMELPLTFDAAIWRLIIIITIDTALREPPSLALILLNLALFLVQLSLSLSNEYATAFF